TAGVAGGPVGCPRAKAGPSPSIHQFTRNFPAKRRTSRRAGIESDSMLHHRALGRDLDQLLVSVIDNRRPMLAMMRAMLAAVGAGRIETHQTPQEALLAMRRSAPDVVIAAASMQPFGGADLVRSMRHKDAGPLCFVPAMIM